MRWSFLGRTDYTEALALQQQLREGILSGRCPDILILLEHSPVITLGRSAIRANVLVSDEELSRRGVELMRVGRGGDVTYHAPGQLVGYPLRRVGRAVKRHVQGMAEAVVSVLDEELGIESWWGEEHPGIWTSKGKIAAVGVDARGGVAMHGFALNVSTDLKGFRLIVPCGVDAPVTSIEDMLTREAAPTVPDMAGHMARELARRYGTVAEEVAPERVRGGAV
jgi:lipoyl(octanoyl) transferase